MAQILLALEGLIVETTRTSTGAQVNIYPIGKGSTPPLTELLIRYDPQDGYRLEDQEGLRIVLKQIMRTRKRENRVYLAFDFIMFVLNVDKAVPATAS